ncbi:MAG: primosomal protein N' [Kiritimatiellae bacterium]|nr:primosomal protein N' [Kiritimatiellia bacterium]MDD4341194.1 primosomal protein N' [Kiritimatiellia bacterium]
MPPTIARIITDLALDREFDYRIPDAWIGQVSIGSVVRIPFGRRHTRGLVTALVEHSAWPDLKAIESVSSAPPLVDAAMLRLARWMADYYAAPFEQAIAAILPAAIRREGAKFKKQLIARVVDGREPTAQEEEHLAKRSPRQAAAWAHLKDVRVATAAALDAETGVSRAGLRSLEKRGWIEVAPGVIRRNPHERLTVLPTVAPALMDEQTAALAAVHEQMTAKRPGVILLHGVTGSGKTEVYLAAIQTALDAGKGAIALVPEISLTPQAMERFRGRFGDTVAVLHSHLSDGERHDEWQRIAAGDARVVVGARSALFAPVRPLGLLVVDEEHEPAYKQDESPRYNARDVAVMRGHLDGCAVVLGSATPSLESFQNARNGKYRLVQMRRRVDCRLMPVVRGIDMRVETEKAGTPHLLSQDLIDAIRLRLDRAEQTILFLNRRGFATTLMCPLCGHVETCPNCSVKLTYHRQSEQLLCHVCGEVRSVPALCSNPDCRKPTIKMSGVGTQRVEAAVAKIFPRARIARMDSDTTGAKDSHAQILGRFRRGDLDILVGTQMIAKGLDFPNVTLVGVILADLSLQMPDFRAAERTFQLLTQVAGRAGRGDVPGEVLVQTYAPFHPAVQSARHADAVTFFDQEIEMRRELGYPPFTRLTTVLFKGRDEQAVTACAKEAAARLKANVPATVKLTGPAPAPLAKAKGYYRVQFMLRSAAVRDYVPALRGLLKAFTLPKGVAVAVNVDALSLM